MYQIWNLFKLFDWLINIDHQHHHHNHHHQSQHRNVNSWHFYGGENLWYWRKQTTNTVMIEFLFWKKINRNSTLFFWPTHLYLFYTPCVWKLSFHYLCVCFFYVKFLTIIIVIIIIRFRCFTSLTKLDNNNKHTSFCVFKYHSF